MRTLILTLLLAATAPAQSTIVLYETNSITRIGQVNLFTVELKNPGTGEKIRASAFLSLGVNLNGWIVPGCGAGVVKCHLVRDGLFWLTFQAIPGAHPGTTIKARNWYIMTFLTDTNPQYQWMELTLPNNPRLIGVTFYGQAIAFDPYFSCGPTIFDLEAIFTSAIAQFMVRA